MNTTKLQIEVTKYMFCSLYRRETNATLFGDAQERITIAAKVILGSKSVKDGFELAFKIIQVILLYFTQLVVT